MAGPRESGDWAQVLFRRSGRKLPFASRTRGSDRQPSRRAGRMPLELLEERTLLATWTGAAGDGSDSLAAQTGAEITLFGEAGDDSYVLTASSDPQDSTTVALSECSAGPAARNLVSTLIRVLKPPAYQRN